MVRFRTDGVFVRSGKKRSVNADLMTMLQETEVQCGNVAEADNKLRIAPGRRKIQFISDPIGSLATACGKDRPNIGITKRGIEIRQPLFIGSGKIVPLTKSMLAEIDGETPVFQHFSMSQNHASIGRAGGGYKTYSIARPEWWGHQHLIEICVIQ
ncbi:hypothetical protein FHT28_000600 [Rhizobium sp. SG570]|nr:hypothetical protein [Rhizobium sp. SG570]